MKNDEETGHNIWIHIIAGIHNCFADNLAEARLGAIIFF